MSTPNSADKSLLNSMVWSYLQGVDPVLAANFRKTTRARSPRQNAPTLEKIYQHYMFTTPDVHRIRKRGKPNHVPKIRQDLELAQPGVNIGNADVTQVQNEEDETIDLTVFDDPSSRKRRHIDTEAIPELRLDPQPGRSHLLPGEEHDIRDPFHIFTHKLPERPLASIVLADLKSLSGIQKEILAPFLHLQLGDILFPKIKKHPLTVTSASTQNILSVTVKKRAKHSLHDEHMQPNKPVLDRNAIVDILQRYLVATVEQGAETVSYNAKSVLENMSHKLPSNTDHLPFAMHVPKDENDNENKKIVRKGINKNKKTEVNERAEYKKLLQLEEQDLILNIDPFTCGVCLTECEPGAGWCLHECLHSYCRTCGADLVNSCAEAQVGCPYRSEEGAACSGVLRAPEVRALVTAPEYEAHLAKGLRLAENSMKDSFHCRTPDCPGFVVHDANVELFLCPLCGKTNCLRCQEIHSDETCEKYQERCGREAAFAGAGAAGAMTKTALELLLKNGAAMHCPGCRMLIEKDPHSCDWVKCEMCKMEICWATKGPRWGPGGLGDNFGGCQCKLNGKRCHPNCKNCH